MSKKELRKELELLLLKTIEDVLNKRNEGAAKKMRKTTHEASKAVAKKFYRAVKPKKKAISKTKASLGKVKPAKSFLKTKAVSKLKSIKAKKKK